MKRKLLTLLFLGCMQLLSAQDFSTLPSWYGGVQGGTSFAHSAFTSWGTHGTIGFTTGGFVGYQFNSLLSVEVFGDFSKVFLSTRSCDADYWLGSDGMRYQAAVAGMTGWAYSDLKSNVAMQRYGFRGNLNVLSFFNHKVASRWSLNVSPALSAIGTKATLKSIADDRDVLKNSTKWHLGVGGSIMAGYQLTSHLSAALYSGITYLTGSAMDALPRHSHRNNFIWESGIRLGWSFGKKTNRSVVVIVDNPTEPIAVVSDAVVEQPVMADTVIIAQSAQSNESVALVAPADTCSASGPLFPQIYFSFNSIWVEPNQRETVNAIAETMKHTPSMQVVITGYTDSVGSKQVNERISLQRAQVVKQQLQRLGIAGERITVKAGGINRQAATDAAARTAVTISLRKEEQQ